MPMRPKLLTKRQQLGIFNTPNAVDLMREYVSYGKDVLFVAQKRMHTTSLEKFIKRAEKQGDVTEIQKQLFQNLSEEDAHEIFFKLNGHIYPEVFLKMLDTFPKDVSAELLLKYNTYCSLTDEVVAEAIGVLGESVRELIFTIKFLDIDVFNRILRVFGKEQTMKLLVEYTQDEKRHFSYEVEKKIGRIYSEENLKELLRIFIERNVDIDDDFVVKVFKVCSNGEIKEFIELSIENSFGLNGKAFVKIFDVCSSKEEVKKLLEQAIENNMDLWFETLDKIVEYFPPEEARALLEAFFNETSPGRCEYDKHEKEEYYEKLEE